MEILAFIGRIVELTEITAGNSAVQRNVRAADNPETDTCETKEDEEGVLSLYKTRCKVSAHPRGLLSAIFPFSIFRFLPMFTLGRFTRVLEKLTRFSNGHMQTDISVLLEASHTSTGEQIAPFLVTLVPSIPDNKFFPMTTRVLVVSHMEVCIHFGKVHLYFDTLAKSTCDFGFAQIAARFKKIFGNIHTRFGQILFPNTQTLSGRLILGRVLLHLHVLSVWWGVHVF